MFQQDKDSTPSSEKTLQPQSAEESMFNELSDDQLNSVVGGTAFDMFRLQNVMDRHNQAMTVMSNIMQKTSQTNAQIIQNIK